MATKEHARLEEARTGTAAWKKWGPYLSERQWGTVREDYSESGDAWNFFTHDHARSQTPSSTAWRVWLRLDLVPERLADGPGGTARLAHQPACTPAWKLRRVGDD